MSLKQLTIIALSITILASCGGSKKFQASVTEDRSLFAAINELNKRPNNQKAVTDLKALYTNAVQRHEDAIDAYKDSRDENRFDLMLQRLNALQNIYSAIQATPAAISVVRPRSYERDIQQVKEVAAEYFYEKGRDFLDRDGRENALEAYAAFKQSSRYISSYKDARQLIQKAYDRGVITVVVNPLEESRIGFSSMGSFGVDFRYRPEDYQQSLARDLDARNADDDRPARFLTDRQARRDRIQPDWEINIAWRSLDGRLMQPTRSSRQVSKSIQIGSDTAGKPVYRTVYATLQVVQQTFLVRGDIEYEVRDLEQRRNVDYGSVSDDVEWRESYATYSGDSRALSDQDWALINNANAQNRALSPTRGDIMSELMRELYPNLRSRIERNFR